MTLYDALAAYAGEDCYPFHMPGHKRNVRLAGFGGHLAADDAASARTEAARLAAMGDPYAIDITEIDGFDDLHCAEGILRGAMDRAARLYGSEDTYFLVNGSTGGILAGIASCARHGDSVILARNCHKSVYHGVLLHGLRPAYLYPKESGVPGICGEIRPEEAERVLLEHPDARLMIVTSPTYEGIVSNVAALAEVAHSHGIPLLVDEAHGAHFLGLHPAFPQSSVSLGADLVVHGIHKTLPSLTQTALLHRNGPLVRREDVGRYLSMYQTSSPSYVLMASIDRCMELLERRGEELFGAYAENLRRFYEETEGLRNIRLLSREARAACDISKIVLLTRDASGSATVPIMGDAITGDAIARASIAGDVTARAAVAQGGAPMRNARRADFPMTGRRLYDLLRDEFHLQMEMCAGNYVIAMTSIADRREGFDRLSTALWEVDRRMGAEGMSPIGAKREASGEGKPRASAWREAPREEALRENAFGEKAPRADSKEKGSWRMPRPKMRLTPYEAEGARGRRVPLSKSEGRISKEFAYLYPPGVPLLVPGEEIDREVLDLLAYEKERGLSIRGLADREACSIQVTD